MTFIKRVIGLPGEWVEGSGGKVWICSRSRRGGCQGAAAEPFASVAAHERLRSDARCPQGHYFVMGDNRGNSEDSRDWGTIPAASIVGLARVRYWPPQRIGPLS